jgi:pyruvate/2-oxoglutarate dehydrogenase complex dihydrolipoamide acyltransferase (E2) component
MTDVLLPQWGMNMEEGTITRWLKQEGDAVTLGEELAEVETDKISANIESPAAGVLKQIVVPAGQIAKVRDVVAIIEEAT